MSLKDGFRLTHERGKGSSRWNLEWLDLLIFKEDIKSCFKHLRWSTRSSKLLATIVDPEVVFVMLTGGGWDVVGQAILRRVISSCPPAQFFLFRRRATWVL